MFPLKHLHTPVPDSQIPLLGPPHIGVPGHFVGISRISSIFAAIVALLAICSSSKLAPSDSARVSSEFSSSAVFMMAGFRMAVLSDGASRAALRVPISSLIIASFS